MRHSGRVYVALLLAAAALRIGFVFSTADAVAFRSPLPSLDIAQYWEAARQLRAGAGYSYELAACSTPLFVYVVAALQVLCDESLFVVRLVIAALSSLRFPLLYWIARRLGLGLTPALIGTSLLVALPSLVYFDTMVIKATLDVTLLTLLFAAVIHQPANARGRWLLGLTVGGLLGLAFLDQLITALYVVPVVGFLLLRPGETPSGRFQLALPAVLVFSVTFGAFQFRGSMVDSAHFLPRAGADLYQGVGPDAVGYYRRLPDLPGTPYGHAFEGRMRAEIAEGRPLTPEEADAHYVRRAAHYVLDHPARTLRLALHKAELFFNDFEIKDIHYLGSIEAHSRILRGSPAGFGLLIVLGTLGVVALVRTRRWDLLVLCGGIVAALLASTLLSLVNWRYRLPAIVPLGILTGFGCQLIAAEIATLRASARSMRTWARFAGIVLLPTLVAGFVAFRPVLDQMREPDFEDGFTQRSLRADKVRELAEVNREKLRSLPREEPSLERAGLLRGLHRHTDSMRTLTPVVLADEQQAARDRAVEGNLEWVTWADNQYITYLVWRGELDQARRFNQELRAASPAYYELLRKEARGALRDYRPVFLE